MASLQALQRSLGNRSMQRFLSGGQQPATNTSPDLGPGRPLSGALRSHFEGRFDYDFSRVRLHTDGQADTLAQRFDARAFTTGNDIVFRQGGYDPDSAAGRNLLAHELTHVVQQSEALRFSLRVSQPGDSAEVEAERVAAAVSAGGVAGPIGAAPAAIARQPAPAPGKDYIEFEIDPGGPPGQINAHFTGPTDNAKWVDRALTAAGYTIWLNGFMIFLDGMKPDDPGIVVPESDVDFAAQKAEPINHYIYNSRAEARAAVAKAPPVSKGAVPFAYYWGAGGLVVVPTTICTGSAPRTVATMWNARKDYAEYVQHALAELAVGMLVGKALSGAYGWARAGGGGRRPIKPPRGLTEPSSGNQPGKAQSTEPTVKAPDAKASPTKAQSTEPTVKAPDAKASPTKAPSTEPTVKAPAVDVPKTGPELFKQTAQVPGGQAEKVKFFDQQAAGLQQRTGWTANRTGDATDGSVVYHGEGQNKALVITRDGRVFTGTWLEHVKLQVGPTGPQLVCDWSLPGWKQW
jgi:hypothetical protein